MHYGTVSKININSDNSMKSIASFSEHSLSIRTPISFMLIISVTGLILLATGIYTFNWIYPFGHLLIGFGILFVCGGLFFMLNTKYYKIHFNEEPGYLSLVESTGWEISPFKIPLKYFTDVLMQYTLNDKRKPEYEIILKNRLGSMLLVSKFSNEKEARAFSEKMEANLGLPLSVRTDIELDSVNRKHPYNPYPLFLPDGSTVKTAENRNSVSISWKVKYHPLQVAFILGFYYGFFHILHFSLIPAAGVNMIGVIVIYTTLGILLSLLISALLSSLVNRYYITVSKDEIHTYHTLFGKKTGEIKMKKEDIAIIRSTIEPSNETIIIASRKGIGALNNLLKKFVFGVKDIKKILEIEEIISIRDEIIRLDVSTLSLIEKLYIDQFILKNF